MKKSFEIIEHQKAILSEKFSHQSIFKGPNRGMIFYYWSKKNDIESHFDFSKFAAFKLPKPIQYASGGSLIKHYHRLNYQYEFIDSFESSLNDETGFLKPNMRFIRSSITSVIDLEQLYKNLLSKFNLENELMISPAKFNELCEYRNNLFIQLERQATMVTEINKLIAAVLKFVVYFLSDQQKSYSPISQYMINQINTFFHFHVLSGSKSVDANFDWLAIDSKSDTVKHALEATKCGLMYLLNIRDPLISVSVKLSEMILPIEKILEESFINNRLLSPREYSLSLLPSTIQVAKHIHEKAKKTHYPIELKAKAMEIVRDYIVDHKPTTLYGKVNQLTKIIFETLFEGDENKPSKNTLVDWIKKYADAAGVKY